MGGLEIKINRPYHGGRPPTKRIERLEEEVKERRGDHGRGGGQRGRRVALEEKQLNRKLPPIRNVRGGKRENTKSFGDWE